MGKLASFATGVGEGLLAAKRYKDTKKRADKQDELLERALTGGNSASDIPLDMDDETAEMVGLKRKANGGMIGKTKKPMGYASGGMIGEMPRHHDKMSWQRGSFKK